MDLSLFIRPATASYTYDALHRMTDLAYTQDSTNLFTPYEWSYDNMSRITQMVSDDGTSDYTYDSASQLTAADHDYQTDESYSYDANGNRTMTGYSTGTNNQLTNDGTYSYTYDDEGNRLTRTHDTTDESTEYEWDHRNRLVSVTEKDEYDTTTQVVEYIYDVFNRRIGRAIDTTSPFDMEDAVIERYIIDDASGVASPDGGNVVLDFVDPDGDGETAIDLAKRYLFGNAVDQLLAQEDVTESIASADRILWPLADHLGTTRDLVQNDGTLDEHCQYDSFGQVTSGDPSFTRYLFTAREYDGASGLQYNRARWYDAQSGRWIGEDPLGFEAGDSNIARYVHNGPSMRVDASGLVDTEYYETPTGQQEYKAWFDNMNGTWTVMPATWNPNSTTVGDHAYNLLYGFSDVSTLGMGPLVRYMLGYDPEIDRTDGWYWVGAAIPVIAVTGGAAVLPHGVGAPVFGITSVGGVTIGSPTGAGAYRTVLQYRALIGVSAETQRLLRIAALQQRLTRAATAMNRALANGNVADAQLHGRTLVTIMDMLTVLGGA